jgi:hypothetical protein
MSKAGEAGKDEVVGRGKGHGNFSWKPRDSIADAFGAGLPAPKDPVKLRPGRELGI